MSQGVARVTVAMNGGIPRTAYNIWHVGLSDTINADLQPAVDAMRDFYTGCASLFPSTVTITVGASAVVIDHTPPLIMSPTPRTVVGTGTGGASAAQLANVVSWRTLFAGKSFRGRTYLGPIAVSALTGGILGTTVVTAVQTAANAIVAANLAASTWNIGVWSHKLSTNTQIQSAVTNSKVETQRRRNR